MGVATGPEEPLASRKAERTSWSQPVLVAVLTGLAMVRVWGSMQETATIFHDEAAYLLQARIFASGRWTAPAPPLPEFFEQFHVLVTPVLAAKYWPGHSIVLVPGVWLALPNLIPVLMTAVSGGMLFALTRRTTSSLVAGIAWLVWLTSRGTLFFHPTYLSEVTTSVLWLGALWALLEWRETSRPSWLVVLASCFAWAAITRPLTAIALCLPVVAVVARELITRGPLRQLMYGTIPFLVVLSLVPVWSSRTTGDWRRTPYTEYLTLYFPFDRLGFGFDSTPPKRALPPDMAKFTKEMSVPFREHTLSNLPAVFAQRLVTIGADMWGGKRVVLFPLAMLGIILSPPAVCFALGSALLLVISYLPYGFTSRWSVYYLEIQPVLAVVTAVGVWRLLQIVKARLTWAPRALAAVGGLYLIGLAAYAVVRVETFRKIREFVITPKTRLASALTGIPDSAIVFVRYAPDHDVHMSLIENSENLTETRVWVARDREHENRRLLELAPGRKAYVYDEARHALRLATPADF